MTEEQKAKAAEMAYKSALEFLGDWGAAQVRCVRRCSSLPLALGRVVENTRESCAQVAYVVAKVNSLERVEELAELMEVCQKLNADTLGATHAQLGAFAARRIRAAAYEP